MTHHHLLKTVSAAASQSYVERVTSVLGNATELMHAEKIVFFSEKEQKVSVDNLTSCNCDCDCN